MLNLTQLMVLAAVARHGSVTEAAKDLHYSQPSVSHHLRRLEAATGARLIQRVGRGIRLTPEGELLAGRAITGMTLGAPRVDVGSRATAIPTSCVRLTASRRSGGDRRLPALRLGCAGGAFGPPGRGGHCCTGASLITPRTASSDAPSAGNPTNPQVAPAAA